MTGKRNFASNRDSRLRLAAKDARSVAFCYRPAMPATPAWPPASTPRLFIDLPLGPDAAPVIDGPAAHYLLNVMRLKAGDPLLLFDNRSGEWLATVAEAGKRSLTARITRLTRVREAVPDLWLCFAPVKKARLDWIIEKATELGVTRLQPVITERTIVERVKRERLEAQIVEACEQCGRTAVPDLADPVKLPQLLADWPQARALLFADEAGGAPLGEGGAGPPAAILTGPEGGFTARERDLLLACPAVRRIALGPRILRAETAAIAAISLWMGHYGDWR
jgi:16S rRNA (uracil1498-N3)-methyltransferase